jgi:glycosyltransferase involved in cell wall biosynthesis
MFRELLESLKRQKFIDIELVIAVGKLEFEIESEIEKYKNAFKIRIIEGSKDGISANLNAAITACSNEIVKLLCQDDYLRSATALARLNRKLKHSKKKWYLATTMHLNHRTGVISRRLEPKLSDFLFLGKNTVSSPSVVAIRKSAYVPLDEKFNLMCDCEWYVRMFHHFGHPIIDKKATIVNRVHDMQSQNKLKDQLFQEIQLLKICHTKMIEDFCGECRCIESIQI